MVNTLNNSPEKVSSKGGNKFKKAIALAIALTLSGQPAEGKTYEKREFPTEMVANNPGEVSLINENVEQISVPNYINRAQNGVRKYYPQFEEYFKPIFSKINGISNNAKRIINEKIQENFEIFEEEIEGEKNKCGIILMVFEQLMGTSKFENTINITNDSKEISKEISGDINNQIKKEINNTRNETNNVRNETNNVRNETEKAKKRNNKLKEIINYLNNGRANKETTEMITLKMEEYFNLFDINEIRENTGLQKVIKEYIGLNKQINRTPNPKGKAFINEYYKINR